MSDDLIDRLRRAIDRAEERLLRKRYATKRTKREPYADYQKAVSRARAEAAAAILMQPEIGAVARHTGA